MTNLKATSDIYDHHEEGQLKPESRLDFPLIEYAIDPKESHIQKIREIGFARKTIKANYEALPFEDASLDNIFYYTPHGLKDHQRALEEAHRTLKPNGKMLILLYKSDFNGDFICHRLGEKLRGKTGSYFRRLDNGRHAELTNLARSPKDWENLFLTLGFEITQTASGLSGLAWKFYDTQTRPILKPLISAFNRLPTRTRKQTKTAWMIAWFPILFGFYLLASRDYIKTKGHDCYIAYELRKQRHNNEHRASEQIAERPAEKDKNEGTRNLTKHPT